MTNNHTHTPIADSSEAGTGGSQALREADVRWAVNVLLEKIAEKFEAWDTWDLWRSEAASTVRSFKHDLAALDADKDGAKKSEGGTCVCCGKPAVGKCEGSPPTPAQSTAGEPVHIGIDRGSGDQTGLMLRRGTDVFTFFGPEAEAIIAALSAPVGEDGK